MTNRYQQQPLTDEESATLHSNELIKKKKRLKIAIYAVAFIIFQTAVITVFMLTVMKVKTPKARFGSVAVQDLTTTGSANGSTPSFKATLLTQLTVNNPNFGPYRFDANTATFSYGGVQVGTATVPPGKAGAMSRKNVDLTVTVDSSALTSTAELGGELGSDVLTLTGRAELSGSVRLLMVLRRKRSAEVDCTLTVNVSNKTVQDLKCK